MKPIEKIRSLLPPKVIGLALAASILFGAGAGIALALDPQTSSESSSAPKSFAGTWHWIFDGRSFATMTLILTKAGLTGTVTTSRIKLNEDGSLLRADPGEDPTPEVIEKATWEGSALRIKVADGFQFVLTLKDAIHAEIQPVSAPANMKPIQAEKVH